MKQPVKHSWKTKGKPGQMERHPWFLVKTSQYHKDVTSKLIIEIP